MSAPDYIRLTVPLDHCSGCGEAHIRWIDHRLRLDNGNVAPECFKRYVDRLVEERVRAVLAERVE